MNVYVITQNHYLYTGIMHSLNALSHFNILFAHPEEKSTELLFKNITCQDVLLLAPGKQAFSFQLLLAASRSHASVIHASPVENFHFQTIFGFTVINSRFYLSDLLQALSVRNNFGRRVLYPGITHQEKKILFHTWRGRTVDEIAGYLGVMPKTVYQHQRNALKKIGIRKTKDLFLLPKNFIEFMYLEHRA